MKTNIIYNDNCAHKMEEIPDLSIDLTVTSPPYDGIRDYDGYKFEFEGIAKELFRITKQGGIVVWVVADETKNFCETLTSFKQAIFFVEICGFNLLDTMIYKKRNYAPAYPNIRRYAQVFEYMFVFSKGKPKTFNPLKERKSLSSISNRPSTATFRQKDGSLVKMSVDLNNVDKSRTNVWEYAVGSRSSSEDKIAFDHPAIFPEDLAEDHILTWSNEGDIVLDPMCGSGTTCKIAKINRRKYIGIDISEKYYQITKKRVNHYHVQTVIN